MLLVPLVLLAAAAAAPRDLALLGTVYRPEGGVALLRSEGRTRVTAVGETAFGGRLVKVGPTSATLEFDGASIEVRLPGEVAAPKPMPRLPQVAEAPEDPSTPARDMARVELERRLAGETPRILAETVIVPFTDDGRVAGFTLTRLPENSLLTDAGLRAGDVVVRINGTAIDSLPTLIGLWGRLQSEARLHAEVLRGGKPISLVVNLR